MGVVKILFKVFVSHSVYVMVVDQTQRTAAPGEQEKLFALHDLLDRLNILHSHLQFPWMVSFFPKQPYTRTFSLYQLRQKGNYFFSQLPAALVYLFLIPQPFTTLANAQRPLTPSQQNGLLCQLGCHSAYKGSLFYPWSITQEFQRSFFVEFNNLLPLSCL